MRITPQMTNVAPELSFFVLLLFLKVGSTAWKDYKVLISTRIAASYDFEGERVEKQVKQLKGSITKASNKFILTKTNYQHVLQISFVYCQKLFKSYILDYDI